VLSSEPVTTDDLDDLIEAAIEADDPARCAAELVDIVEQRRLADPIDAGPALIAAADLTERTGDLDAALALVERAITAFRAEREDDVLPLIYRGELLVRLGRDEEGMAEFAALRPKLTVDSDMVEHLTEALETTDHADVAERWLTEALESILAEVKALGEESLAAEDPDAPDERGVTTWVLAQERHRLRRHLQLPHDQLDELADELETDMAPLLEDDDDWDDDDWDEDDDGGEGHRTPSIMVWPQAEFERLLARWPALAESHRQNWDGYRAMLETAFAGLWEIGPNHLVLVRGSVEGLASFADDRDADPTDRAVIDSYAESLAPGPLALTWPPGRNDPCWCGSPQKYKKCCLPRSRT
jgi:hypothetical protein